MNDKKNDKKNKTLLVEYIKMSCRKDLEHKNLAYDLALKYIDELTDIMTLLDMYRHLDYMKKQLLKDEELERLGKANIRNLCRLEEQIKIEESLKYQSLNDEERIQNKNIPKEILFKPTFKDSDSEIKDNGNVNGNEYKNLNEFSKNQKQNEITTRTLISERIEIKKN